MAMSAHPGLDELIWLFEVEPVPLHDDVVWPAGSYTFTTQRASQEVQLTLDPLSDSVAVSLTVDGRPTVDLDLYLAVERVALDRTHGAEALVITPHRWSGLDEVRLQMKPHVHIAIQARRPWDIPLRPPR
jgi:hypothetical protein